MNALWHYLHVPVSGILRNVIHFRLKKGILVLRLRNADEVFIGH